MAESGNGNGLGGKLPESQPHGGAIYQGGVPGHRGGSGRPTQTFQRRMQALADRAAQALEAAKIIDNPDHPQFLEAAKWCADRGYGKPLQKVEATGADGVPLIPPGKLSPEEVQQHVNRIMASHGNGHG